MVDESCRIRVIRAYLKMTSKEMGALLGVNANTITNWEHGHASPRSESRMKLAVLCHENGIGIRSDGWPLPEISDVQ